jgi:GTP-binding protein
VVVLNKMDLPDVRASWPGIAAKLRALGADAPLATSAVTGEGVQDVLRRAADLLAELPVFFPGASDQAADVAPKPAVSAPEDKSFTVERDSDDIWHVQGAYIEKIVKMTKWEYYDAVMRFQRIMEALGITDALNARGVQPGDTVRIGEMELEWSD